MSDRARHGELTEAPPQVTPGQAARIVRQLYGLPGEMRALQGERDANFHLRHADGRAFMVKFINAAEPAQVSDFQLAMLRHIAREDSGLPVPAVISSLNGDAQPQADIGDGRLRLRVVSYLAGIPQSQATPGAPLMRHLGRTLARLDRALAGFSHAGARRALLWDVSRSDQALPYLSFMRDGDQRRVAGQVLERFAQHVRPRLAALRQQVIHNDLNPHNVLVQEQDNGKVAGVIDFGDALQAPLIGDLATALAYQLSDGDDMLAFVRPFIAAYHRELPLREEEVALLPDLLAARMALTITLTQWRATLYPHNRDYILRNLPRCWRSLQRLLACAPQDSAARLWQCCRQERG
ncbi:phosphotransferase [Affinibrenneria salicis]|uniref:Hydroxylysine kinase n=1 Tax=Affinibrenneria salicis TaxID=2590031 RepID=A0A5J5G4Z7_9GAMM|nr:phosphotransferase [Affinibrenneria salicis]KAA9001953.1 phosphotransferase [Affinibrenneria salicis]